MTVRRTTWYATWPTALVWSGVGMMNGAAIVHMTDDDGIKPSEPCAMSMSEAQAEDDICAAWVDDRGNVIIGPLSSRTGQPTP